MGIAVNGVATYGHWGRPVLAFPAERGDAGEFERRGMVDAIGDMLAAGRVKLYCVDSFDGESWSNRSIPLEERARRHQAYESWILEQVVPFDPRGLRRRRRTDRLRVQPRRVSRRQLRAQARRRVPARDLHVGQL